MPQMESAFLPSWAAGFYGAVSEQFTRFATLQLDGSEVANSTGQYLNSSITQLVAGYDVTSRFALQVNVPLIYREFKRPEGFQIDRGTVSGLGDISLLLKTVLFHYASPARRSFDFQDKNPVAVEHEPDFAVSAILLTGIKFPTGDSSRLEEEFHEVDIPGAPESGIHGHDLTLGTGSYDGIFGEQMAMRYKNVFFETNVQFTLRGDGTHQYHFANDLVWNGGPGYYVVRNRDTIFGVQCVVSGEYKDVDRFRGALEMLEFLLATTAICVPCYSSAARESGPCPQPHFGIAPQLSQSLHCLKRLPDQERGFQSIAIVHAILHFPCTQFQQEETEAGSHQGSPTRWR